MVKDKIRLFYPDAYRGIAMFSVLLGHMSAFSFGLYGHSVVMYSIDWIFPGLCMFMIISGYFYNPRNIKKRLKLLIPFFVFGLLYSYLRPDYNVSSFIFDRTKYGYWFLYELVIFNIIVWIFDKLRINKAIGFAVLEIGVMFTYFIFFRHTIIGDIVGLFYWMLYLPFFFIGMYVKYISIEKIYKYKNSIYVLCPLLGIFLYSACKYFEDSYWVANGLDIIEGIPIGLFLLILFYDLEKQSKSWNLMLKQLVKRIGSDIGRYTLEIYVLHYFVLYWFSDLRCIGDYIKENNCYWIEYLISPIIGVLVCYICIFVAKLFEKLKLTIIFGK